MHKTASCPLPWLAGGEGNSLGKSLDLAVEDRPSVLQAV